MRVRIDAGEIGAPGISDPQNIGALVRAHAARPLRPGKRIVEVRLVVALVKLARLRRDPIHLVLDGRQIDFLRFAGRAVTLADDVQRHFRPPSVAVAIARRTIGDAGTVRSFVGDRLELRERLGLWIETQRPVRCRRPDAALAVVIHGDGATGRRHSLRRHIDIDPLRLRVQAPETTATVVHVEPDDAVFIPGHAVSLGGKTVRRRHLEQFDRAGLRIDLAERRAPVRNVAGEPQLAVEIEPGVVHAPARNQHGRRAERPVAAVVLYEIAG